ncbi:peroxiredoxin [Sphingomonas aracearum]|uniref:thioredoxin-dependent peroxiredoxin n=1 Tax=Sphingomonas aracearum TaxID=2283317 RepID=A0A369W0U8_9SPHN|nr:peroxiredoxin [Sphingomonas aracearum]RDE06980.1 peroxiredoxin [Sphingomonas aracearum]
MKRHALLLAAAALLAAPASAALKPGAKAPAFATQAATGGKVSTFDLSAALKKGPVVLYFFPAAFTSGCTVEAHEFAEASDDFARAGATLIGLSADPIDKLADFSVKECRNKFPVGVAQAPTIAGYDVAHAVAKNRTDRTSYVIAPNGRILYALSQPNPAGHVQGTLAAVREWRAKHPK